MEKVLQYVDPDDPWGDEERKPKTKAKKLFGSTQTEKDALAATGRAEIGFRDNDQLKKFRALTENALGGTDEALVWQAWIDHRIQEAAHFNKKAINISLDQLIHRIAMKDKRDEWMLDNRAKVLSSKLEKVTKEDGLDDMLKRAGKKDE